MSAWFYSESYGLPHWQVWTTDTVALIALVVVALWARWTIREATRDRRWMPAPWRLAEDEANEAWALHRDAAYDHALRIAWDNGDLIRALLERAQDVGDAFRGVGVAARAAVVPANALGKKIGALDPYSRRV